MRISDYRLSSRKLVLGALLIILLSYLVYQGRFIIFGPQITVFYPQDGEVLTGPLVLITGQVKNVAWLNLNGGPIFNDKKGFFEEKLLVATGTSIIELKARDHFGREEKVHIRVTLP